VGDPPALAAALDAVLADPARARRLAEGGRAVAAGYTWPVLAERVSEVYAAVTGAGPAGRAGRASSSGAAVDGVGAQPLPDPA
jgi:phosphatidylinositol alpha-mannosyltransferase